MALHLRNSIFRFWQNRHSEVLDMAALSVNVQVSLRAATCKRVWASAKGDLVLRRGFTDGAELLRRWQRGGPSVDQLRGHGVVHDRLPCALLPVVEVQHQKHPEVELEFIRAVLLLLDSSSGS